jgi:hypothetical protein
MAQPLRQEDSTTANLLTTRTENSRLWFVNNADLEYEILAALARYQCNHGVMLYAFVLQGTHDHLTSTFPNANRAMFMRDQDSPTRSLRPCRGETLFVRWRTKGYGTATTPRGLHYS